MTNTVTFAEESLPDDNLGESPGCLRLFPAPPQLSPSRPLRQARALHISSRGRPCGRFCNPGKLKLSCRLKEYIFKYIVGAREAKTLAMTRGWGLDVCSIARSTLRQRQATQGYKIGFKTLIRWESIGNRRRGGGGLMASRIPALPRDSHVQSHAAVHKINCVIPALRSQRERSQVAGFGPVPGIDERLLLGGSLGKL
jgi:hypothetical protein